MKWILTSARRGDLIRVGFHGLYHYGVYLSDDCVVQFGRNPIHHDPTPAEQVEVLATDLADFLAGGFLEVCSLSPLERLQARPREKVARCALSRLGERGYHILTNNCEHFATSCLTGKPVCTQAEALRRSLRERPLLDVYLLPIASDAPLPPIEDPEVAAMPEGEEKRRRAFARLLLEYALFRSLGLTPERAAVHKNADGKPLSERCFLSLSHSGSFAAVALSRKPVGVDLEAKARAIPPDGAARHFLTEREAKAICPEKLLMVWTQKEALFKAFGSGRFEPKTIETENAPVKSFQPLPDVFLSVAGNELASLRCFFVRQTEDGLRGEEVIGSSLS